MLVFLIALFSFVSTIHSSEQSPLIKVSDEYNNQLRTTIKDPKTITIRVARYSGAHLVSLGLLTTGLAAAGFAYLCGRLKEQSVQYIWNKHALTIRHQAQFVQLVSKFFALGFGITLLGRLLQGPAHSKEIVVSLPDGIVRAELDESYDASK